MIRRRPRPDRPASTPGPCAYRVPWVVDRSSAPDYQIVNIGDEELRGVTISAFGSSRVLIGAPAIVGPGEAIRTSVLGPDPARDTLLVLRWFTPNGAQYLWQVSF